jgi:hypothetical protein
MVSCQLSVGKIFSPYLLPLASCLLPSLREFNDEEGTQNLVDLAISE